MRPHLLAAILLAATPLATVRAAGGFEIRGRITAVGRPLGGATVKAFAAQSSLESARRQAQGTPAAPALANTASRPDGAFVLVVPGAATGVSLRVDAPGLLAVRLEGAGPEGESLDLGEIRLRRGIPLGGRIVDSRGHPLQGATIVLDPGRPLLGGGEWTPEPVVTRSGADGAFVVPTAAESGNRLRVEAAGFASVGRAGVRAGSLDSPLVLSPAAPLAGRVLAQDGRAPAAGVLVSVVGRGTRSGYVLTGADGRFEVKDAPASAERVVADAGAVGRAELSLKGHVSGSLTLQLALPSVLTGRIVDASSGAPLPRVRLEARGAERTEETRSGPDGRYRIEGLPPGRYRVSANEERCVPYARDDIAVAAGRPVTVDVPLRLAASIAGRVVDEDGRPVAGATGRLRPASASRFDLRRSLLGDDDSALFRTGADGTFRATRVAPGDNQQLAVSHPEFERRTVAGLDLSPGRARSGLTVVMRRGLEIAGRVIDAEGRPVTAAEVELRPSASERAGRGGMFFVELPGRRGGGGEPTVQSAADGRFRASGLGPGSYALHARKDGYAEAGVDPVRVERGEPAPDVEVKLPAGATIRGHVRHPDGSPAQGQMVRARGEAGGDPGAGPLGFGPLEATGEDGAFAIEGLRAGETYSLNVLGPAGPQAPSRLTGVRAPADEVEIVVPGVGRIAGRVVDAQSREPLPEFTAAYEPELPQGMGMRFLRAPRRLLRRLGTEDEEGDFRSPDGTFALDDVPAGVFTVVVEARGYESARVSGVVVREGETTAEVEVRATRGKAIRGRVLDGITGRPVVGATVAAQEADRPGPPLPPGLEDGASFTDADGRFDIPGLGLGVFKLVARHPEYAEASRMVELRNDQAEVEIRLSNGGALGGLVVSEAGAPVGGASVQLQDGGGGGGVGFQFGPGGAGGTQTLSDDGGGFRFERLAAGRYSVTASLRGRSSAPVDVALQTGEARRDLRVPLDAGATLRGRVVGLDPATLSTTNVSASGRQGYFAGVRPATDGAFTVGGVPAGPIELRAMAGDFAAGMRTASAQVEIAEGQTEAEAEIVFGARGAISGQVTRGGQAVGEVMLSVSGSRGFGAFARSDSTGAYRLEGLEDGSYTVTASPPSGAAHRKTVKVEGEATLDFDLPLARLSGSVQEAGSARPLADAEVEAETADAGPGGAFGRGQPRATTDSNGRFALEGLTPGTVQLTARRTGYLYERRAVDAREDGGPELTLELRRGEGLGLRVRDGVHGVPLHSLFVEARDGAGALVFAGPLSLDSDGRGEVPSLRPGAYGVKLSAFGYAPFALRATVPSPTLEVALMEGGALEVRSGPETQARAPRARLLDGSGSPLVGPPVGPEGFLTLAGATRRLEHLAPGGYVLRVEGGPAKPFTVTEGGTVVVDLP